MIRRLALTGVALGCALLFFQCGTVSTVCDARSCPSGCCDLSGECQAGNQTNNCGKGGDACRTCAVGQTCNDASRVCLFAGSSGGSGGFGGTGGSGGSGGAGGSGGTGGTGGSGGTGGTGGTGGSGGTGGTGGAGGSGGTGGSGGAGGGGGGPTDGGCRVVTTWPSTFKEASYVRATATVDEQHYASLFSGNPATPPFEDLYYEVYYFNGITVPFTRNFPANGDYSSCESCLSLYTGCTAIDTCSGPSYFARGGSANVTVATKSPDAGTLSATLSNVRLVEWNFTADVPVPDGGCVLINTAAYSVTW